MPGPSQATSIEMRRAYYQVVQEESPNFQAEFSALYKTIFPDFAKSLTAQQRFDAIRNSDERGTTTEDRSRVKDFVRRWRLPRDAEYDIWDSFNLAHYGEPLRLWADLPDARTVRLPKRPIRPDPFLYDPLRDPVAAVDQYIEAARGALIRKAKTEQAAAYKQFRRQQLPPPLWRRSHTRAMALRLYRRAVLNQSWLEIAASESAGTSANTVRVSVQTWAKILGVPLPLLSPGRPRKHQN